MIENIRAQSKSSTVLCVHVSVYEIMIQMSSIVTNSQQRVEVPSRGVSCSASGVRNHPKLNLNLGSVTYLVNGLNSQ